MVKVELELVGELKNHGDFLENFESIESECGGYISAEVSDPGEGRGDPGRKLLVKSEIPRGDLEVENTLDFLFSPYGTTNYYSGKFKIKGIPDNIDIQSEIPISMIRHDQSGGGKRKRKKSRPKRKKSKMKRK